MSFLRRLLGVHRASFSPSNDHDKNSILSTESNIMIAGRYTPRKEDGYIVEKRPSVGEAQHRSRSAFYDTSRANPQDARNNNDINNRNLQTYKHNKTSSVSDDLNATRKSCARCGAEELPMHECSDNDDDSGSYDIRLPHKDSLATAERILEARGTQVSYTAETTVQLIATGTAATATQSEAISKATSRLPPTPPPLPSSSSVTLELVELTKHSEFRTN